MNAGKGSRSGEEEDAYGAVEEIFALLTQAVRKVDIKKVAEGVTCYHCMEKGHFGRNCPKEKKGTNHATSTTPDKLCLMSLPNSGEGDETRTEKKDNDTWFIDSGCSEHMTGNMENFVSLQVHHGGRIVFGDNYQGRIVGKGLVKLANSIHVGDVNLVETLGFNLLSLAMLCDQGNNKVTFDKDQCLVQHKPTKKIIMRGKRHHNSYIFDKKFVPESPLCLSSITDTTELWHGRLGHAGSRVINKLHTQKLVVGLPKVQASTEICEDCVGT